MAAKYYIYARGRWCEVDTRNGRVEGFKERARFLFFRGGKLELASTAKVLRGLRALSGGNPGPVRDGPPLPRRKRRHRRRAASGRAPRAEPYFVGFWPCSKEPQSEPCLWQRLHLRGLGARQPLGPRLPLVPTRPRLARPPPRLLSPQQRQAGPSLSARPSPSPAPVSPRKRRIIYSDESPQTRLDKSPVKKALQKQTHNEQVNENVESSSEEVTQRPTRSTASRVRKDKIEDADSSKLRKIQKQNHKILVEKSVELSSEEEITRPTRNTASKIRNDNKIENRDYSKLQKLQKQKLDKLIIDSAESTTEEETKRPTRNTASKVRKDNKVENRDSSEEQVRSPRKLNKQVPNKDHKQKSKKATNNNVSKRGGARLLVGVSETEESDKQRGIGDLDRFDNDEEYKKRVFYRLNPLVTIERCKPLENLLLQKMSLKEFARNLGLRSVAEVTPEKRYRMRLSTKLARAADSETDKENIVQPKRRKLWNNDKEHFTSITSRSSGIKLRNIPKPALNEDSSKDTTDSDTEFKRKVREQFARKSKQRASAAERDKETTSTIVTEKEQRTTRSSIRGPGPLKEQNKSTENKEGKAVQAASSEDVRRTRSSDRVRVPVRALKEQNKGSDSSDSPFVTSKKESSPKKAAKETERNAGKANLKKTKKGKVEEGKVDERVEKMKSAVVRSMTAQPVKIRALKAERVKEHIAAVKNRHVNKSAIADYLLGSGPDYWIELHNPKILSTERHFYSRMVERTAGARVHQSGGPRHRGLGVDGGPERRVNGNALWRELQADYKRITGQDRSWHSLRNRYLRYVLPSLGRLALPRNRSAGCGPPPPPFVFSIAFLLVHEEKNRSSHIFVGNGQLKTGGPPRRNSIYGAPVVRSASARAARPPPEQTPAPKRPADEPPPDKHTPPRATGRSPRRASPSYSAITRKFARTRAATSLTSSPLTLSTKRRK
ncbi:hypothetical protein MSG28_014390 [Choristoneura fumiferana]|uniref:Uncharacterized protein n=1 Tax=Choristoneura fumiferana TaxID=7141 RepID=A0ACC0JR73_CHOFU|nr:hypothetical protein MSG28_014390 [Choristoneura fumiferana]